MYSPFGHMGDMWTQAAVSITARQGAPDGLFELLQDGNQLYSQPRNPNNSSEQYRIPRVATVADTCPRVALQLEILHCSNELHRAGF